MAFKPKLVKFIYRATSGKNIDSHLRRVYGNFFKHTVGTIATQISLKAVNFLFAYSGCI